jgi:ABC-type glycerol-3-phosphate transport system permease component
MATSGIIVVAILKFVQVWGNYLFVLTMIDDRWNLTASVGLAIVRSWTGVGDQYVVPESADPIAPYGVLAAANFIVMVPVVLFYLALQRWFVRGLTEGVLKF